MQTGIQSQYPLQNGTVADCHPTCNSCSGNTENDCISCNSSYRLTSSNSCESKDLVLLSAVYEESSQKIVLRFSAKIATSLNTASVASLGVFDVDASLASRLTNLSLDSAAGLNAQRSRRASDAEVTTLEVFSDSLHISLKFSKYFTNQTFIGVWSNQEIARMDSNPQIVYPFATIVVQKVSHPYSSRRPILADPATRTLMDAAGHATAGLTALIMIFSPTGGFALLRLFQNLDLYGFIDCNTPRHLSIVLDTLTGDPLELAPNVLSTLVDEKGDELPERFLRYNIQKHIINNFGRQVELVAVVAAVRLILKIIYLVTKSYPGRARTFIRKALKYTKVKVWAELMEAYIIDFVLSMTIFLTVRPKPLSVPDAICAFCFGFLAGFILVYLIFSVFKIRAIAKQSGPNTIADKSALSKISPNFYFLLEDKYSLSFLGKYLNVIMCFREALLAFLVFTLYPSPLLFLVIKLGTKLFLLVWVMRSKIMLLKLDNFQIKCQTLLFALLDLGFLLILVLDTSLGEDEMSWYLGYPCIGIIATLILLKLGVGLYGVLITLKSFCKNEKSVKHASPASSDKTCASTIKKPSMNRMILNKKARVIREGVIAMAENRRPSDRSISPPSKVLLTDASSTVSSQVKRRQWKRVSSSVMQSQRQIGSSKKII